MKHMVEISFKDRMKNEYVRQLELDCDKRWMTETETMNLLKFVSSELGVGDQFYKINIEWFERRRKTFSGADISTEASKNFVNGCFYTFCMLFDLSIK